MIKTLVGGGPKHPNKGHTPNKGQRPVSQSVRYSETPLYTYIALDLLVCLFYCSLFFGAVSFLSLIAGGKYHFRLFNSLQTNRKEGRHRTGIETLHNHIPLV